MINKFDALLRRWGFGKEDEMALCEFLAQRYPTVALNAAKDRRASLDQIVAAVAGVYGYALPDLARKGRSASEFPVLRCRATIIDILNAPHLWGIGRPAIGQRYLGGRDNSTVISTWRKHFRWDKEYEESIRIVTSMARLDYDETLQSLKAIHANHDDDRGAGSESGADGV